MSRGNHKLLVLDLDTRKINTSFEVGEDPGVLPYDSGLGHLYVAAESGVVSVFRAQSGQVAEVAERLLGRNAHVVAVDPGTHRTYFPPKNLGGQPVLRIMSLDSRTAP